MSALQYNRKDFLKTLAGAGMATALIKFPLSVVAQSENLPTFTILHTNDWHSRIEPFPMDGGKYQGMGGAAYRAELIKQIRNETEHVLLLDSGDMFQGTPYYSFYGGELEFKLMSEMKYDCATLGNHDFDGGIDGLKKQLPHAAFSIINANYDFSGTELKNTFEPYKIYTLGKIKVGVIGIGIDLQGLVPDNNRKGLVYNDPIMAANNNAQYLKENKGCDIVIVLSHLGYKYADDKVSDEVLAQKTKNIDLILGGHTHTFMETPVNTTNLDGETTIINQTGWGGVMLGRLDFTMVSGQILKNPQSSMLKVSTKSI
ncbi:MAG TPA: metallophosphatase [Bacteroidia bacterium]|nr:metallophosphatase [Bacteroidia bacterium]